MLTMLVEAFIILNQNLFEPTFSSHLITSVFADNPMMQFLNNKEIIPYQSVLLTVNECSLGLD